MGVDGTPESTRALHWAAGWAQDRRGQVRLVTAVDRWPAPFDASRREQVHARAVRHLAQLAESFADLDVSLDVVAGSPVRALVAASRDSDAVVLGTRGLDGLRGIFSCSVAGDVSAYAQCVVVVLPPTASDGCRRGPVVVGVDGSPESAEAADFACAEAARRGCDVLAVAVHPEVDQPATALSDLAAERKALRDAATAELSAVVEPMLSDWPHVAVRTRVLGGEPATELGRMAQDAPMVVVGSRGRGGFAGLLLGSTSRELLTSAPCPVAVVRSAPS